MSTDIFNDYHLTLYEMSISRSIRPKWLAAELDILPNLTLKQIALLQGEHRKPEFLAINKMATIPTLTLTHKQTNQQLVISESAAICTFLTDFAPNGHTLKPDPQNVLANAAYQRWIHLAAASMDPQIWLIRVHQELLPEAERSPQVVKAARRYVLDRIVPTLEQALQDVEFICEPYHVGFTTADIVVGYACLFANRYGLLDDSPILMKYLDRVTGRDAFLKVWPGQRMS